MKAARKAPARSSAAQSSAGKPAAAKPATKVAPSPPPLDIEEAGSCGPLEPYDPADYRWVPVRRVPRYDGWTEEKQRRFIEVLADTGQVGLAAKAVGLSREAAYKLRRSPHGAAFARAWDAARAQAGSFIEDVAFERAIEGIEQPVFDGDGEVVATRRVYNDRLLMFLLRSLKPERYARHALASLAQTLPDRPAEALLAESLGALEPRLPAPAEALLGAEQLEHELVVADIADGALPHFDREQRAPARKIDPKLAQIARGYEIERDLDKLGTLTPEQNDDWAAFHEAVDPLPRSKKRYR